MGRLEASSAGSSRVARRPAQHARVDRIYREAATLFSQAGLDGVTTRDIAKASGTTMALLYYHFGSKEALYEEIVQLRCEEFLESVLSAWRKIPEALKKPSVMVELVFDAVIADPTFFHLIQHDLNLASTGEAPASGHRYTRLIAMVGQTLPLSRNKDADDTETLALASLITGYCELLLASPEMRGSGRTAFIERHRRTVVQLVAKMF